MNRFIPYPEVSSVVPQPLSLGIPLDPFITMEISLLHTAG